MKIGYVSDLHMEFLKYPPNLQITDQGDILIVAGDLCTAYSLPERKTDANARSLKKSLHKLQADIFSQYKHVLYVMGNHEHYHHIFGDTPKVLREFFKDSNVILMNNDIFQYEDVVFIGATLWSDYEKENPISMMDCQYGMNDFNYIYISDKPVVNVTPNFFIREFNVSKTYIQEELRTFKEKKCVVITHHGPTLTSLNKRHVSNGLDGAYCSDLSDLILENPNIKYWVHGHTHMSCNYSVGDNTKVISNQCGYQGEISHKLFKGIQHVEL